MTWNKQKEILKTDFVRKHKIECDKAFKCVTFTSYKTDEARLLINIARHQLKYSPKTSDIDIFYGLLKTYKKVL